jgi:non-canonical poly(A) RNA polymerase PAPD5/7
MGPLMKPPRTRLTCRAHNRYSPSIALWEHFFGTTNRPLPCHQRLASTIAEITQDGTEGDAQFEPDNALEEHDQHIAPAPQIRRMTTVKGTWRPSKVDASIARNLQYVYATRQSSMNDVEELLAAARAAFQDGRDYEGAVVQSIQHPTPVKESALPWSLPKEDMNIGGIER